VSRRSDSGLDGILLIDKPPAWTSHDVVARARRITGQRRIGHTGTLDPMATGLLVLCLGRATRLVEYLLGHDKRYTGVIALGRTTSTDDAEGETLKESRVPEIPADLLEEVLARFRGRISQRPPAFSALKVQGKRAYQLARAGAPPEMLEREVTIHPLIGRVAAPTTIEIDVTCSAGTYVRSLARDIGEALGCGAHLAALRRERAGLFDLGDAVSLEHLQSVVDSETLAQILLPADEAILDMDAALLSDAGAAALSNGLKWTLAEPIPPHPRIRIYGPGGEFVGVGSVSEFAQIRAAKVFVTPKSAL
jgi:tRNA pseudouridine55 synthase